MELKQKSINGKDFEVDKKAKFTTFRIIKHYYQCFDNDKENPLNIRGFSVRSFIDFCSERFGDYIPDSLSESGIYKRLRRLEKNQLIKSKNVGKRRIHYCLTSIGIKKLNQIGFLKGGITTT